MTYVIDQDFVSIVTIASILLSTLSILLFVLLYVTNGESYKPEPFLISFLLSLPSAIVSPIMGNYAVRWGTQMQYVTALKICCISALLSIVALLAGLFFATYGWNVPMKNKTTGVFVVIISTLMLWDIFFIIYSVFNT